MRKVDVKPGQGSVKLRENDVKLSEDDVKLSEHDVKLSEEDVKLREEYVKLGEHDVKLGGHDLFLNRDYEVRSKLNAMLRECKAMQIWCDRLEKMDYDELLFNHSLAAPVIFLSLTAIDLTGR